MGSRSTITQQTAQTLPKPIYEELPGWSEDILTIVHGEDLPENAAIMSAVSANWLESAFPTFSVGPGREQTNILESVWSSL